MVAGARLALEAGWTVRGSDNPLYPPTSDMVKALGVPVAEGFAAENLDWDPDVVLIGNVLSRGNEEVEAALSRRLRYMSLPEWLKENVLRQRRPVAICGTHGKTTTTALTAHVLRAVGMDAGYLIGGQPLGFDHSAHLGAEGAPFVIEGDEYDTAFFDKRAKFLHYLPEIAVVTSIEFDHGDIYMDLSAIETAFERMLRQVPREGWLVACADTDAQKLTAKAFSNVTTYGFSDQAAWRCEAGAVSDGRTPLTLYRDGARWLETTVALAGRHNLQNAAAAANVAGLLGASAEAVAQALASFRGVKRRMEVFLEHGNIIFVDDFAHHPTAIAGTIAAARERWPGRRLVVAFEPRSNTTVTNRFQGDLTESLTGADEVWLGPIYRSERIPEDERLDRAAVCEHLCAQGGQASYEDDIEVLARELVDNVDGETLVLILSNGAFGGLYAHLSRLATCENPE